MDRSTFTGLFLILIILVGSFYLTKPSEEEIKQEQQRQDSVAMTNTAVSQSPGDSLAQQSQLATAVDSSTLRGPFGAGVAGADELFVLENELIKANISAKGGRVSSVELKGERTYDGKPLVLFQGNENQFGLSFTTTDNTLIYTNELYFNPVGTADSLSIQNQTGTSISLRLNYDENRYIDYIYALQPDSYQLGLTIVTKGLQNVVSPSTNTLNLQIATSLPQKEQDLQDERQRSTAYFKVLNGDVDDLSTSKDDAEVLPAKTEWISFKQHYFSSVLINDSGFEGGEVKVMTSTNDTIVKSFYANALLAFSRQDINNYPLSFYFGPNKFHTLKDQGRDLEKQVDMGWGPMRWINRLVTLPVFNALESFNWNYGLIIFVLTVLIKVVLSPLTYKSYLSMAKMRVLKPEMDQIKEKVGEDNQTLLQQEYLKLYKQAGVNPMGGCLPVLLQMPFMMAFFFFFPNLFELRGESFLWMNDLSTYDALISFNKIPIINLDHISLMCILMTCATLLTTWYNNATTGAAGQMKYIGFIMPLVFFFVLNSYPSGLNYYYFLSTCFTFLIQVFIRRSVNDEKIHAMIQANKKKPESKKKSTFQQRMEEYMREQQQKSKKK